MNASGGCGDAKRDPVAPFFPSCVNSPEYSRTFKRSVMRAESARAACPMSTVTKSATRRAGPHRLHLSILPPYHPGVSSGRVWLKCTHGVTKSSHPRAAWRTGTRCLGLNTAQMRQTELRGVGALLRWRPLGNGDRAKFPLSLACDSMVGWLSLLWQFYHWRGSTVTLFVTAFSLWVFQLIQAEELNTHTFSWWKGSLPILFSVKVCKTHTFPILWLAW